MREDQQAGGFSGPVSMQTLAEVVQLYVLSGVTGALQVHTDEAEGCVWFQRGEVVRASYVDIAATLEGEPAFFAILAWGRGEFLMRPDIVAPERNISAPWQQLLLESTRRLDEGNRVESGGSTGWTLRPPSMAGPEVDVAWDLFGDSVSQHLVAKESLMNIKESLTKLSLLDGFIGACVVDSDSGMTLGTEGGGGALNLDMAAAGNTEVVRAKRKTMQSLNLKDAIEDILISLGKQYHLIRPLKIKPAVFFYVALDRQRSNLALARLALADVEKDLQL